MNSERFGIVMAALFTAFGQEITEARLTAYQMGLGDIPIAELETAVREAIRGCKFMPKPAELRELSGELRVDDRALIAWEAATRAVFHGSYRHIDFDDPAINAAIRSLGGWPAFCESCDRGENEKFTRAQFLKAYQSFHRAGVSEDAGKPLAGLAEGQVSPTGKGTVPAIPKRIETGLPVKQRQPAIGENKSAGETPRIRFKSTGDS